MNTIMKYTTIKLLFTIIFLLFISTGTSYAYQEASASSATLQPKMSVVNTDERVEILEKYLNEYNSPLASSAASFV